MLVEEFPKASETFLLHQMTGLLDAGVDLDIYANHRATDEVEHAPVESYGLDQRVTYAEPPDALPTRLRTGVPKFLRALLSAPEAALRTLDAPRYAPGTFHTAGIHRLAAVADRHAAYDVIHAQFGTVGNAYRWWFDSVATPVVVSFYGHDASAALAEQPDRYDALFERADCITVLSEDMRADLEAAGCPSVKVRKQPLAIDTSQFTYRDRRTHDSPIEILSVCRLAEKKGLRYGIDAVADLVDEYDVHYRIAGDGPLRDDLEQQVTDRGIDDVVEFEGFVDQSTVVELLHAADVFLAPSVTSERGDKEGTPTVLLEAQATGLPVVATRHAGIPEVVDDGDSGLLVPERDTDALETALATLCGAPQRRHEMGKKGRQLVETTHSIPRMVDRLTSIYSDVMGDHR